MALAGMDLDGTSEPYIGCHTHAHAHPCPWILSGHGCDVIVHGWALLRYYCSWVGMGEHEFCASLHPSPNQSQTSRMQEIR